MSEVIVFKYISKDERSKLPDSDFGYVSGDRRLFPVRNQDDLDAAAKLIGRAKGLSDEDRAAVKKKLISIGRKKKLSLPKSWMAEMSDDVINELVENILFSAEPEDILEITLDDKLITLQVVEIKQVNND